MKYKLQLFFISLVGYVIYGSFSDKDSSDSWVETWRSRGKTPILLENKGRWELYIVESKTQPDEC